MLTRIPSFALLLGLASMAAMPAMAQTYSPSAIALLHAIEKQPNQLARADYLVETIPSLSASNRMLAQQYLAFSQSELGIYSQAVLSFPLTIRPPDDLKLPDKGEWIARSAADVISNEAGDRHIVMVNEAHHDAHTRALILALLPRLYAQGFRYFAAEALSTKDPDLPQRGYPVAASGTEYVSEPIYGEIVRTALRLGFVVIPYDTDDSEIQARESGQAENIYRQVFKHHPDARLFVQAGYAHIDKRPGRLGSVTPMAMHLKALTGYDPLSIDQTEFLETNWDQTDDYHQLVQRFSITQASVLVAADSGKDGDGMTWSDRPKLYDMNVILPPVLDIAAFGDKPKYRIGSHGTIESIGMDKEHVVENYVDAHLLTVNHMQRPRWLMLDGQRIRYAISTALCRHHLPCVVEAHYSAESANAVSADRYAFMQEHASSELYLYPGSYRLQALDIHSRTISEQNMQIRKP